MAVEYITKGNDDGSCMGQSASEKISHHGATPVVQAANQAVGSDLATTQALANAIRTLLIDSGLMAAS